VSKAAPASAAARRRISRSVAGSGSARPQSKVFGQDAYPGIWEKAAALMESLGRNHALIDGNKRLAWNATWLFLGINGHSLGESLDEDAAEQFVLDVVTGKLEIQQIATGLLAFAA
jgi:death-on-curing protein